jgi:hypothetical protein
MKSFFILILTAGIALSAGLYSFGFKKKQIENSTISNITNKIIVMELFTSQGCSSCPPADELLGKYAMSPDNDIIALSFHVDYWNRLGWKDPFSKPEFSERQRMYAEKIPGGSVYTPQLIINGEKEMVGSQRDLILKEISQYSDRNTVNIKIVSSTIIGNKLEVEYNITGADQNGVLNIALVQQKAQTNIKAGENRGLNITNYNVVRSFAVTKISAGGKVILNIPEDMKMQNFSAVLYTQENASGKITGGIQKLIQ